MSIESTNGQASAGTAERIMKISSDMSSSGVEFGKSFVVKPAPEKDPRYLALRNFAFSVTVFSIFGYLFLGFEQARLFPLIALATSYTMELTLETLAAWAYHRPAAYRGRGFRGLYEFLLPAHITGLALNFLVYTGDQWRPIVFAVAVAVGTKWILRAKINGKMKHFMNPSNFGIVVAVLVLPMFTIVPPYHFTEYVGSDAGWVIVMALLTAGTLLNAQLTKKTPLIIAWVLTFAAQAVIRGLFEPNISMLAALAPMTGLGFILYTNYMITDPATSPFQKRHQIAFGISIAAAYAVITALHIAFALFFALFVVCATRGLYWWTRNFIEWRQSRATKAADVTPPETEPAELSAAAAG